MAHATLLVTRGRSLPAALPELFRACLERSLPPGLDRAPVEVQQDGGLLLGVVNPVGSVLRSGGAACLGRLAEAPASWHRPGGAVPAGAFVLLRSDRDRVELVSDPVASRSLWYGSTPEWFLASTQQRPLVALLGAFELDRRVLPWVLSSGYPGHGLSWDRRISLLPAGSVLRWDRRSWRGEVRSERIEIGPAEAGSRSGEDGDGGREETRLRRVLEERVPLYGRDPLGQGDLSRWVMTLSGGFDSRVVLHSLRSSGLGRSVTWGVAGSEIAAGTDARVAERIARELSLDHRFWPLDPPPGRGDRVLESFVLQAEGRIDHLSGYTDGFRLWRRLWQEGTVGIVRGDEAFGLIGLRVEGPGDVRPAVGGATVRDFRNLRPFAEAIEEACGAQEWPGELERRSGESLAQWRDRLHQQYRIPLVMGALNALKASYLEICNPLLDREIVRVTRTLPDPSRREKRTFKKIARGSVPGIPLATSRGGVVDLLAREEAVALVEDVLGSRLLRDLLPGELVDAVRQGWRAARGRHPAGAGEGLQSWLERRLKLGLRKALPAALTTALRRKVRPPLLPPATLAFRLYLAARTVEIFREEARWGRRRRSRS